MVGRPVIVEEKAKQMPRSFKLDKSLLTTFRMYSGDGEQVEVSLLCENEMMDAMIDRFGEKVKRKRRMKRISGLRYRCL